MVGRWTWWWVPVGDGALRLMTVVAIFPTGNVLLMEDRSDSVAILRLMSASDLAATCTQTSAPRPSAPA